MASIMATRTLQDARSIKVVVVPLGGMSRARFQRCFSVLQRTQTLSMQALTAPSDWKRMQSPFKALNWYDGALLFEYVPFSAPGGGLSDLDDIQASRRIIAAVGLLDWQPGVEQLDIEAELRTKTKAYSSICVQRYFVFGFPFDNQAALPAVSNSRSLIMFPPDDDTNDNAVTCFHCQVVMSEMAVRVILHFEGLISSGEHIMKAKAGKYPAWVLATTAFDDPSDNADPKKLKKRMSGRIQKLIGDMCMQVCSPRDALEHYNIACADCKANNDAVWYASALEGAAAAIMLLWELDQPLEDFIRELRDAEDEAGRAERIYRSVEEKVLDALAIYSKQQNFAMLEVELCFKFARTLATSTKHVQHSRTLDYLLRALSVPGLGMQQQIECTLEAGLLCKRMGLWRKQALFMYLASLLSADLGNDHASHAIARCAAQLYGVTYERGGGGGGGGDFSEARSLTSEYETSVVTTSPSSSFAVMRRVLLAQIASYAAESDDPIAATRYYAALLRLIGQSEAQKEHYRKLASMASPRPAMRTVSCPEPSEEPNLMPLIPRASFRMMSDVNPRIPNLTPSVVSSHDDDTMSQASDFLKSSMRRFKVPEIASRVRSLLRVGRTDKQEEDHILSVLEEIPLEAQEDALQFMLSLAQRLPPACPVDVTGLPGLISLRPLQLSAGLCPIAMNSARPKAAESSFFFSPFEQRRRQLAGAARKALWCVNTVGKVVVVFSNPLAVPLRIHHVSVVADGVNCSAYSGSLQIPPQTGAFEAVLTIKPMSPGQLHIRGVRFHIFNAMHFLPVDSHGNGKSPHVEVAHPWEYPRRAKPAITEGAATAATAAVGGNSNGNTGRQGRGSREDVTGVPTDTIDVAPALPELVVRLGWAPQAVEINAGECRIEWLRLENVSELESIRDMQISVAQTMAMSSQKDAVVVVGKKEAAESVTEIVRRWSVEDKDAMSAQQQRLEDAQSEAKGSEEGGKPNPFLDELAAAIVRGYSGSGPDADPVVWRARILEAEQRCPQMVCVPLLPTALVPSPDQEGAVLLGPQQHLYLPILLRHVPLVGNFSLTLKYTSMLPSESANADRYMRQATVQVDVAGATAASCTKMVSLTPSTGLPDVERRQLADVLGSVAAPRSRPGDAAATTTTQLNSVTAYCALAVTITNTKAVAVRVAKNPCSVLVDHGTGVDVAGCTAAAAAASASASASASSIPAAAAAVATTSSSTSNHDEHQTLVITDRFSALIPAQSSRTFLLYLPRLRRGDFADADLARRVREEIERHCTLYWRIEYSQTPRHGVVPLDPAALSAQVVQACLLPRLSIEHELPADASAASHVPIRDAPPAASANGHLGRGSSSGASDAGMASFTAEEPVVELLSPMSVGITPRNTVGRTGYQTVAARRFQDFSVTVRNQSSAEALKANILIIVAADDPSSVNSTQPRLAVLPPSVMIMGRLEHRSVEVPAGGSVTRSVKLNFTAPGLFKIVCCFSLQDGEWWCEDVPAKVRVIVPSV